MQTRRKVLCGLGAAAIQLSAAAPVWASSWVDLGFAVVSLDRESDRIEVQAGWRLFRKLRLKVEGNTVFLHTATVTFENGTAVRYRFDAEISEGGRTGAVDLPGEARHLRSIDLAYRRAAGGGMAVVTLQGLPR